MSRYQNSCSQPAAGPRRPRCGGREGAPAWSAAWTAAATSCAVSASMTMFRRSSTRRTTCPACGGASCGPTLAGEGPVASGSVTLGTVKETVLARLLDTPDLQRLFTTVPGSARSVRDCAGDHVANCSFLDGSQTHVVGRLWERPTDGSRAQSRCRETCSRSKVLERGGCASDPRRRPGLAGAPPVIMPSTSRRYHPYLASETLAPASSKSLPAPGPGKRSVTNERDTGSALPPGYVHRNATDDRLTVT